MQVCRVTLHDKNWTSMPMHNALDHRIRGITVYLWLAPIGSLVCTNPGSFSRCLGFRDSWLWRPARKAEGSDDLCVKELCGALTLQC